MMARQEHRERWPFWARWAFASVLGLVVGLVVFVAVGVLGGEALEDGPDFVFGVVLGLIFGVSFGTAHAWALRRVLARRGPWVLATTTGFVVASFVVFAFLRGADTDTPLTLKVSHALVLGGALGSAQAWVLRTTVSGPHLWVAISVAGWTVAELAAAGGQGLPPPLDLIVLFLLGSALPGIGMPWLLRHPAPVVEG